MFPGFDAESAIPEWQAVQQAIARSREQDATTWAGFAACQRVEVYTDGSAPLRNPGGPAGFATVVVGYAQATGQEACVHLDLGGFIPARAAEPATSNNRAEIAGVLAAWALLPQLGQGPWMRTPVMIWSDSNYTVNCGNGTWQRKKNTDLWPIFDRLAWAARQAIPGGVQLEWVKGHADNPHNARADELATRAAFDFDEQAYTRYRAAQAATGREMPGVAALKQVSPPSTAQRAAESAPAMAPPPTAAQATSSADKAQPASIADWIADTDYTLVLHTRLPSSGQSGGAGGQAMGCYLLAARDGRVREVESSLPEAHSIDEAEYHNLNAALRILSERITAGGRDPANYTVTVYSHQELVVKQLTGAYRVKAAALQLPYATARDLIRLFEAVALVWKRAEEIKPLFARTPH